MQQQRLQEAATAGRGPQIVEMLTVPITTAVKSALSNIDSRPNESILFTDHHPRTGTYAVSSDLHGCRHRIARQESACFWVVVSGAEVVEAEVGVVLFAAIQVVVRRGAGLVDHVAEGIVFVGVGHCAGEFVNCRTVPQPS